VKIFLQTFGCKANQYDTELLRTKMESGGATPVRDAREADLCVVNSCSVTAAADKECRQFVRRLLKENDHARVVVTGCYASHAPGELRSLSPRVEVYSNQEKENLPSCLGFEVSPEAYGLSRFSTRVRAFVKIQDGCQAPCKYCIIPTTRPDLWNKPADRVLREVETLVREGHGEIVFTGIRLGLYLGTSRDEGEREGGGEGEKRPKARRLNLTALLKEVTALPYDFRVRLSSLEVTEVTDPLVEFAASSPKVCRHFHIPMQSADDGVLKAMGRWYTFADYADRARKIRSLMPDCALTADVMVGYPAETDEAFENTLRRVESLEMTDLHVFRYSPRPGTAAAQLKPVHHATVKARAERLIALAERMNLAFRVRHAGSARRAVAEPSGDGWTDNYIRVKVPSGAEPGALVPVTV
jgi:threonylcarbamoyladenosine tRNA methylthiotransferase MtaB